MRANAVGLALCVAVLTSPPSPAEPVEIPAIEFASDDPQLRRIGATLFYQGHAFSGHVLERQAGRVVARTPHWQGLREGVAHGWHPNGQLAFERFYRRDNRHGTHRGWWPDGALQFERNYRDDRFEGQQRSWFASGAPHEVGNYLDGREEGRQQQFAEDGRLVANYVVKDGRRFGVVGRFDCVTVGGH